MKIENLNKYLLRELLKPKNKEVFILHQGDEYTYIGDAFHMYRIPNDKVYIDLSKFVFRKASDETIKCLFKEPDGDLYYTDKITFEAKTPLYIFNRTEPDRKPVYIQTKFFEFIDPKDCTYKISHIGGPVLIKENDKPIAICMPYTYNK